MVGDASKGSSGSGPDTEAVACIVLPVCHAAGAKQRAYVGCKSAAVEALPVGQDEHSTAWTSRGGCSEVGEHGSHSAVWRHRWPDQHRRTFPGRVCLRAW